MHILDHSVIEQEKATGKKLPTGRAMMAWIWLIIYYVTCSMTGLTLTKRFKRDKPEIQKEKETFTMTDHREGKDKEEIQHPSAIEIRKIEGREIGLAGAQSSSATREENRRERLRKPRTWKQETEGEGSE